MIFSGYWMLWSILFPMTAAFVLQLMHHFAPGRTRKWLLFSAAATAAATLAAAATGCGKPEVLHIGGWSAALGILLVTDRLSAVFLLISAFGGAAAAWRAFCALPETSAGKERWRFCGLFFILWAAINGILVTGDLFNLFVFFEILAVSTYVLVGAAMTRESLEAGLKYLVLGTVGALFLLLGIALLYMGGGVLNFALLSSVMDSIPRGARAAAGSCIVVGLGLKMGMFPFHFWLPDAHSTASTEVSMILSGVVVKASFYALLRVTILFFPDVREGVSVLNVLLVLGVLSLFAGHLPAQRQADVKRMLAWSTVAHMGYLLVGIGCASPLGIAGALFHALNHAAAKIGLFLGAGSFSALAGAGEWRSFQGLGRRFPGESAAFALLAGSLIGLPPLSGFWSKWMIILAAMEKGYWAAALAVGAGTALSCAYYVPVLFQLFGSQQIEESFKKNALSGSFQSSRLMLGLGATTVFFALLYLVPEARDQFLSVGSAALSPELYRSAVLEALIP
jgi:multicomponent Na+:H+ antiporter subunit D